MSIKKGNLELAKNILKTVAAVGILSVVLVLPGMAQLIRQFDPNSRYKRRDVYQKIKYLQRKKFIRYYRKEGKEIIEITENGKTKLLTYNFNDLLIKQPSRWDGYFRLVVFDIPEKMKKSRRLFKYKLSEMGFYSFQDSVLVYPYPCKNEIEFLRNYLLVDKHVKYLLAKEIEGDDVLKKYFKL